MGTAYQALSVFFVVFLLFNSGLVYQVADDSPTSMALETGGDKPVFNGKELRGAEWLISEGNDRPIYVDGMRWWLMLGLDPDHQRYLPANASLVEPNSYLYFGTYNLVRDSIRIEAQKNAVTTATYADLGCSPGTRTGSTIMPAPSSTTGEERTTGTESPPHDREYPRHGRGSGYTHPFFFRIRPTRSVPAAYVQNHAYPMPMRPNRCIRA
jgi:hypothetical protein